MRAISHAAVPIGSNPSSTPLDCFKLSLGHYRMRVYLTSASYIDVGRGSGHAGKNSRSLAENDSVSDLDGKGGDGCVIGAGSVVTKPTEPFGVYAGTPARLISQRPNAETIAKTQWWNWSLPYLINNSARLQELALTEAKHELASDQPRLCAQRVGRSGFRLTGFTHPDGISVAPLNEAPKALQKYIAQIGPGPDHYWLADAWSAEQIELRPTG